MLDASMTIAWVFEDERTRGTDEALQRVEQDGAETSSLWRLEVANGLRAAVKRGRCDEDFVDRALEQFDCLSIRVDPETHARAWGETLRLARREGLTIYDAAYLELALRLGAALATTDRSLVAAARRQGLDVLSG